MRIEHLHLSGVMGLKKNFFALPDTGIVLIQGENGAGKSSVIEAVSMAAYGRGVRSKSVWNPTATSPKINLTIQEVPLAIQRHGPGGPRVKLSFGDAPYESTTHAQEALNKALPLTWRQWRKACVLSSSDSAAFTLASDADRKRVIEDVIGLTALDQAHKNAREECRKKEAALAEAVQAKALVETRIAEIHKRLLDGLPPDELAPPLTSEERSEHSQAQIALQSARADREGAWKALREAQATSMVEGEAQLLDLRTQRKRIGDGKCPTCGQDVGETLLSHLHARIQDLAAVVEKKRASYDEKVALIYEEVAALTEEERSYQREVDQNRKRSMEAEQAELWGKKAESIAAEAGRDLAEAKTEGLTLDAQIHEYTQEISVLRACVQTLSTRGVRSLLVAQTTKALEESANYWLSRLGGELSLEISPYTEKKDGTAKEAISLTYSKRKAEAASSALLALEGDEPPASTHSPSVFNLPYVSASGGERRRIDIALTLALGQISEGGHGQGTSTLFCDEIFDALDTEGMDRAVAILEELSAHRAVIVITHHPTPSLLRAAKTHFYAKEGTLSVPLSQKNQS
ncbi:MAG: hypothetical protein CMQ40_12980 [Gammaproteobacteria bacterium]|nr:hypothetical protein [Gammaproteobacteria bacterium]